MRHRILARSVLVAAVWHGLVALPCPAQTTHATTRPAPAGAAAFEAALRTARPGERILTPFDKLDPKALPPLELSVTPSADAATLVFSDRPEYFRAGDGIACQETVRPGRVRVYTYHVPVPAGGVARRVITLAENLGDKPATLRFAARCEPTATGDYNAIAKEAMTALLRGNGGGQSVTIPVGGHVAGQGTGLIDKPDLLVHGLFEFTTDQPLRITVAQTTATGDVEADVASVGTLPKLPLIPYAGKNDKSGRGLFEDADRDVTIAGGAVYDTAKGAAQVLVADGKRDAWAAGVDGISGAPTSDKGNYGVVYHMRLKWRSTDGRGLAVMMSTARFEPELCGAVCATVRVNDGRNPGGVVELPRGEVRFNGAPGACVIQTFDPPADDETSTIELTYTPPGSCCLPTPILLVPFGR